MVINLIAVGKRMPAWVNEGFVEYTKRLPSTFKLHLTEIPTAKGNITDKTRILRQEGELMLAAIPKDSYVIALEVGGEHWSTEQLASHLLTFRDLNQDLSLLVGGAEGLSKDCLNVAGKKWSLSLLTFPHHLVRVIVAEQLYRAYSILAHHPYHRS